VESEIHSDDAPRWPSSNATAAPYHWKPGNYQPGENNESAAGVVTRVSAARNLTVVIKAERSSSMEMSSNE
jgi:hypothetical protein